MNAAIIVLFGFRTGPNLSSRQELEAFVASGVPARAAEYLRQHPFHGRMLNEFNWGAYLIRALGPTHKVFIDGRADAYDPAGVLSDYLDITRLKPDALLLLHKYDIQACLVARNAPRATWIVRPAAGVPGRSPYIVCP